MSHSSQILSRLEPALVLGLSIGLLVTSLAMSASAQDWGQEADDDWATPTESRSRTQDTTSHGPALTGWSGKFGIGFTASPDSFLMNFEAPYRFDRWVSAGPMIQVGLDDHDTIVAPTANVTVTIPDLPGEDFDAFHPYGFAGMGFAYIEKDNRRNDKSSAGFLVDFGFGVEYQLSERFFLDSQMMFNVLPERTLDQRFFYSWQVLGLRVAF
jgi:opacity protein-like surface antigen